MKYDVTVIGSGPGGYVAAIRCAQLGMKVALIEKYASLGGTCLNVGCIPSKALLDSSEHFHMAQESFTKHGIDLEGIKLNMSQMIARKQEVVDQTVSGVEYLMKKNKIDVFHGHGSFTDRNNLTVRGEEGEINVETNKVIIATGSKPIVPASFNYDKKGVITSTEALNITELPKKMVVVGAGVIGLELGSVFARLGTEVEVVEFVDRALATMDKDCGKELTRSLKKLGFKFHFNHKVDSVDTSDDGVVVHVSSRDGEKTFDIEADYCLVAIGRRPYTDALGLENVGVELDDHGRVKVDDHLQTDVDGIYAIGDVVRGIMLAHKAEEEGIYVAELMSGQKPHVDYNLIPNVVYTWPEVAAVGKTEEELKEAGVPYKSGKFPVKALGRARASGDIQGMIKVLSHKDTDEVLGVHMVTARASDLIMEAVAMMEFRASAEDIARVSHPHPTYSEAMKEAALAATEDRPLHI